MTSGMQRGDLIIVAGRPSMGKNHLCDEYCGACGNPWKIAGGDFQYGNARWAINYADVFFPRTHWAATFTDG